MGHRLIIKTMRSDEAVEIELKPPFFEHSLIVKTERTEEAVALQFKQPAFGHLLTVKIEWSDGRHITIKTINLLTFTNYED